MSGFKRRPLPEDLTAALNAGIHNVPSAVPSEGKRRAPRTIQINFNASEDMGRLVARLAKETGSTRRLFAKLLRDAGHDVPEADLNPIDNRRRWGD